MKPIRYGVLILAICFALLLSALNTAPVFADEAIPPADETTPSEEVVSETEATTSEEEEATPPDVSEVDSVADEESTTVAEVIESLPEDTEVVVLDNTGEVLPLASSEAQEAVQNGDPLWCPAGVVPKPNMGGCSPSFTSFNDDLNPDTGLIVWLLANPSAVGKAGVIWVASNYAPSGGEVGDIIFDGLFFAAPGASMEDFALTINGGWSGLAGSTALDPNNPSEINVPFAITDWKGAVTINNITITGANGTGYALSLQNMSGSVAVNNMDVVGNTTDLGGASINNTAGVGNVTINDSTFTNNTGFLSFGLTVDSLGAINLKNVIVNSNTLAGAQIINAGASTPKPVTITGTSQFNYNGTWGLRILSKGVITLNNITAIGNVNGYGVYADNCDYLAGVCNYGVSSGVTIKGTNNFSDNGWDGLRVVSGGAITVNNITANGNGTSPTRPAATIELGEDFDATGKGVFLLNVGASTSKNITISGTNTFNNNASNGLSALTLGMLTVNNITANGNGCDPLKDTDTSWCAGALLFGNSGVAQTGYGRFEGNDADPDQAGLFVLMNNGKGSITLNNLFALSNGFNGVDIEADGALATPSINVTINGENIFEENGNTGLFIVTDGAVTLNNLTAEGNGGDGVYIENNTYTKAVTLKGVNTFLGNSDHGLFIISYGAITTNAVTASGNFGGGVYVDNCVINVLTCDALTAQPITMNGNNIFEINQGVNNIGLQVVSRGVITLTNLTASNNTSNGIDIKNQFTNSTAGVTLKGYVNTTSNAGAGLEISTNGGVSVINLNANDNTSTGAQISSYNAGKAVTVSGVNVFNNNDGAGLYIQSYGAISTNFLTAIGNVGTGVILDNCFYFAPNCQALLVKPITMNGNNLFQSNGGYGLKISATGAVTVNNLNVSLHTALGGLQIFNGADNAVGGVTIKGYLTALGDNSHGVEIDSNGAVTLANVSAMYNDAGSGMVITNNANAAMPVNVTITGKNNFSGNDQTGLSITTYGAVLLSNITANNTNLGGGAVINNNGGTHAKPVTLNGNNTFNSNAGDGLSITSLGAIKINNIVASYNTGVGSIGADLINNGVVENQPVTITGYGVFNNNGDYGLNIASNGAVTLANINANENVDAGANIDTENNATLTSFANVTITGINTFNSNGSDGLTIYTNGNITVSSITANNNDSYGAYLDNFTYANSGTSGIRTVNVTGTNMFNSNDNGLSVSSRGSVSLTRITANYNDDGAGNGTGLLVSASEGAINLTCGAMYNNIDYGYNLNAGIGKVITLKGVYTYGNILDDDTNVTPVITRTCPLP